jgi:hypothetical protein
VSAALDRAADNYRNGEVVGFDNMATVVDCGLAYTVEIESYRAKVGRAREMTPVAVRVTTIFRREDGTWKVAHRHADPITTTRPPESVNRDIATWSLRGPRHRAARLFWFARKQGGCFLCASDSQHSR